MSLLFDDGGSVTVCLLTGDKRLPSYRSDGWVQLVE